MSDERDDSSGADDEPERVAPDELDGRPSRPARPGRRAWPGRPIPEAPTGSLLRTVVGAASIALILSGLILFGLAVSLVLDPAETRCSLARTYVEQANDDDDEANDVDLGGRDVDDLTCDDAVALAETIPLDTDDSDDEADDETDSDAEAETVTVPSESSVRNEGGIATVLGLAQVAGGVAVLQTRARWARNLAVVSAAAGIIFPVAGVLSLALVAFAIYALTFSGTARALWARGVRSDGGSPPPPSE